MTCKPKHKTLRAALGFGMPGYDPYSFGVMQNAQNNAATRFANSSYDWAAEDRNWAKQNTAFNQGLQTKQFGLQQSQQNFNQGLQRDQFGLQQSQQNFNQGLQRDQFGLQKHQQNFNQGLQQNQQNFNQGLQRDQFGLQADQQRYSQGLQRDQFGLQKDQQTFNQGLQRNQFGLQLQDRALATQNAAQDRVNTQRAGDLAAHVAAQDRYRTQTLQDQDRARARNMGDIQFGLALQNNALDNQYRGLREQRNAADFNRAQAAMSRPRPAMTPYRFGLRNGGEIHAAMGYNYAVPDDPERVPGWIDTFNAKGQGQYVGRDKAKANEYAVAKRNAETTDRMANGGAYPGAVSLDAARNPYKRVADLENMYDDSGYNPYTGIYNGQKKGAGAQWLAMSKYRMKDGGSLRTGMGGDVPGTGKGDKIDAKYEPGEFVVSNDMLAADPALLPHLRELRKAVLAQKGMTPEQADAKAIHMDSEGPGDERGAKDEKESKAVKRGFGIRAKDSFDYIGAEGRGGSDTTLADTVAQAEEERRRIAAERQSADEAERAANMQKLTGSTANFDVPPAAAEKLQEQRASQQAAERNAPPAPNAAPPKEMSTASDVRSITTNPAAKETPPVLQGATGKDVGFGITRFNVPGQSPLFTNMTDEAGMRSNEALISRKPQSDQDRIAGDNISNRFAQRADAEARMAQRQADLQAEYQQGQIDNRAMDSRARQTELAKEIENLNTHLSSRNLSPEEYRRGEKQLELLQTARLNEGSNFGLHENQLATNAATNASNFGIHAATNASNFGIHAADNASREKVAANQLGVTQQELAMKQKDHAIANEISQMQLAARKAYEANPNKETLARLYAQTGVHPDKPILMQPVFSTDPTTGAKSLVSPGYMVYPDGQYKPIEAGAGASTTGGRTIAAGEVVNGFRFKGGDTKDRANWEKA